MQRSPFKNTKGYRLEENILRVAAGDGGSDPMNFVDDVKKLAATVLNRSDIAGVNWLNPLFAVLFLIVVGYSAEVFQSKKDWLAVGIALTAFFVLVIAAILVFGWLSRRMLEQKLKSQGKTPTDFANVSVIFRLIEEQNLTFSDLNLHTIDAVAALCEGGELYYMPLAWYTRRPLARIGREDVLGIESGMQKITRNTVPVGGGSPQIVTATKAVNAASEVEDRMLPLDMMRLVIKTASGNHEFLFQPKERTFAEKLLELYSKKTV
jgi:hypothetical protein